MIVDCSFVAPKREQYDAAVSQASLLDSLVIVEHLLIQDQALVSFLEALSRFNLLLYRTDAIGKPDLHLELGVAQRLESH